MDWLFGLDAGGTKTDLVAAPAAGDGAPQGLWRLSGTSLTRDSPATVAGILEEGVHRACASLGCIPADVAAVCGGFSSAGDAGREAIYRDILHRLLPHARIRLLTDAELTWRGATGGGDGILVIAGTGSIAWGQYRGRSARTGGEGPGHDPGSADDIGRRAVASGVVPAPADGNFAALLSRLAEQHAEGMEGIFHSAARDLLKLVEDCAATLEWSAPVVYTFGGTFRYAPAVLRHFRAICPFPIEAPQASPTQAAIDLARSLLAAAPTHRGSGSLTTDR